MNSLLWFLCLTECGRGNNTELGRKQTGRGLKKRTWPLLLFLFQRCAPPLPMTRSLLLPHWLMPLNLVLPWQSSSDTCCINQVAICHKWWWRQQVDLEVKGRLFFASKNVWSILLYRSCWVQEWYALRDIGANEKEKHWPAVNTHEVPHHVADEECGQGQLPWECHQIHKSSDSLDSIGNTTSKLFSQSMILYFGIFRFYVLEYLGFMFWKYIFSYIAE